MYQLLLILLGLALLIWLVLTLVSRGDDSEVGAPVDSAVVDTAPIPVPAAVTDSAADTVRVDSIP